MPWCRSWTRPAERMPIMDRETRKEIHRNETEIRLRDVLVFMDREGVEMI